MGRGRQGVRRHVLGPEPLILGHAHPALVAARRERAGLGSTFYGLNEPALRLARAFTGREKVLKSEVGWHMPKELMELML